MLKCTPSTTPPTSPKSSLPTLPPQNDQSRTDFQSAQQTTYDPGQASSLDNKTCQQGTIVPTFPQFHSTLSDLAKRCGDSEISCDTITEFLACLDDRQRTRFLKLLNTDRVSESFYRYAFDYFKAAIGLAIKLHKEAKLPSNLATALTFGLIARFDDEELAVKQITTFLNGERYYVIFFKSLCSLLEPYIFFVHSLNEYAKNRLAAYFSLEFNITPSVISKDNALYGIFTDPHINFITLLLDQLSLIQQNTSIPSSTIIILVDSLLSHLLKSTSSNFPSVTILQRITSLIKIQSKLDFTPLNKNRFFLAKCSSKATKVLQELLSSMWPTHANFSGEDIATTITNLCDILTLASAICLKTGWSEISTIYLLKRINDWIKQSTLPDRELTWQIHGISRLFSPNLYHVLTKYPSFSTAMVKRLPIDKLYGSTSIEEIDFVFAAAQSLLLNPNQRLQQSKEEEAV